MRRNFDLGALREKLTGGGTPDPLARWKIALLVLALANPVVYFALVSPPGGSAEYLQEQLDTMRQTALREQGSLMRLRGLVKKIEKARSDQDAFMRQYFMDRRTTSSTILTEVGNSVQKAGLKLREHAFVIEPVEGSENISMMTITGNYEGSYADLVEFVNLVDRSNRFLIIDSIQAAPTQQAGVLASRFKMNTFMRDSSSIPPSATKPADPAPVQEPNFDSPPPARSMAKGDDD